MHGASGAQFSKHISDWFCQITIMMHIFVFTVFVFHMFQMSCSLEGSTGESKTKAESPTSICFNGMAAINKIMDLIGRNHKSKCKENLGRPIDCNDIPNDCPSGIYTIYPKAWTRLKTYCDMDIDGGHWMVFQRRENGFTDFYRGWTDYTNGFGNLNSEFWLGNLHLNKITKQGQYELRIDMTDFEGNSAFAKYNEFSIGDSMSNFTLTAREYYGNSGDGLEYHNGNKFTTKDMDNDNTSGNCAVDYKGAWWFDRCVKADLNGEYFIRTPDAEHRGVYWRAWKGTNYSLKKTAMMLRRRG